MISSEFFDLSSGIILNNREEKINRRLIWDRKGEGIIEGKEKGAANAAPLSITTM